MSRCGSVSSSRRGMSLSPLKSTLSRPTPRGLRTRAPSEKLSPRAVSVLKIPFRVFSSKGGELEQIKFLLGHESILTTERYLGSEQNLKNAVNDTLVFD